MFRDHLVLLCIGLFLISGYADAVNVRGYTRRDGTYVAPHHRSAPDGRFSNNWSTSGNVNPYTGKVGTLDNPSSSYGRRSGSYDAGSYAYPSSSSRDNNAPIADTSRSVAQYGAVQAGTASTRSNPASESHSTSKYEAGSEPQTGRRLRAVVESGPCILNQVMTDAAYYACGGRPPAYPYQYVVDKNQ